jgi:hypothetical protein
MINFLCHQCKHPFELPDDMAGKQIQCPQCMRLVDVPTIDEIGQIAADGTIRMDAPPEGHSPEAFAKMRHAYGREKIDDDGTEKDLRQTAQELAAAGTDAAADELERQNAAPKYDPETGELIRAIGLRQDTRIKPPPLAVPFAHKALDYATPIPRGENNVFIPFIRLFSPVNLAAMFFVLMAHVFMVMMVFSIYVAITVSFIIITGVIAHYGVVIEEIGIEERDELPRFLRHLNITDDIWLPFARIFLAWMICFGLGWIEWIVRANLNHPSPVWILVRAATDLVGLIFFPAIVLTTTTSGSISNLRPDRVLGTVAAIGPRYAFFVILYAVAFFTYVFGIAYTPVSVFNFIFGGPAPWYFRGLASWSSLIVGIFLMHWFSWLLGVEYRTGHMSFPWAFQQMPRLIPGVNAPRHVSKPLVPGSPIHQVIHHTPKPLE